MRKSRNTVIAFTLLRSATSPNRGEFAAALGERAVFHPAAGPQPNPEKTYVEREDDWSAVAYWYQAGPSAPLPALPDRAARSADLIQPDAAKRTDL